jgi:hypothetical protein
MGFPVNGEASDDCSMHASLDAMHKGFAPGVALRCNLSE